MALITYLASGLSPGPLSILDSRFSILDCQFIIMVYHNLYHKINVKLVVLVVSGGLSWGVFPCSFRSGHLS